MLHSMIIFVSSCNLRGNSNEHQQCVFNGEISEIIPNSHEICTFSALISGLLTPGHKSKIIKETNTLIMPPADGFGDH